MINRIIAKFQYLLFNKRQLLDLLRFKNFQKVYVFDIDNTLTRSTLGKPLNFHTPDPRFSTINFAKELIQKGNLVLFLSARSFRLYEITKLWLNKYGLKISKNQPLYLVNSPKEKIKFLKKLIEWNEDVVFIDDLSYNYENGEVKYYLEEKKEILNLSLDYRGLEFIESLPYKNKNEENK
jgi:hypothetical protein